MRWRRLRSLMAPFLAILLVLGTVTSAFSAPSAPAENDLIPLLQSYGLVKGDQFGDLKLYAPITRAEAATIFVRAAGQEQTALMIGSLSSFPDTNGHWAAGFITTAFRLGQMKGRDTGLFDPDAQITNAEVLTVLLRIVHKDLTGTWTPVRAVQAAIDLGIFNGGAPELVANQPGNRGVMFKSLAKALTTVPLETGKTALATYIDKEAPTLQLGDLPGSTGNDKVTVRGSATGAAYVLVNGQKTSLANGVFSVDVSLAPGGNTITVEAYDWAGNVATQSVTVARATEAARLEVSGQLSVAVGKTTTLSVAAYDAKGTLLPASAVTAQVSGSLGSFNATTGTFTAGNTAGKGKVTFTAGKISKDVEIEILGPAPEARTLSLSNGSLLTTINRPVTVNVQVLDSNGSLVTWDSGRPVTLNTTPLAGLQITSSNVVLTNHGVATFTLSGSSEGATTLSAVSPGLNPTTGLLRIASSTRVVLWASTTNAVADGATPVTIRAMLQDENGSIVTNNSGRDVLIQLSLSGTYATLTNSTLIIRSGASSSAGYDGVIIPGLQNDVVTISGTIQSDQTYSVVGTSVAFTRQAMGTPIRFDLAGSAGSITPSTPMSLSVTVRDGAGNVVTSGSYAFQVQVTTNNGEPLVGGVPDGVSVKLGTSSSSLVPVAGATGAVVARTSNGFASLTLTYNKSGNVTVKLLPVTPTVTSYDSAGNPGASTSSTGFTMPERIFTFSGAAAKLKATIDLPQLGLTDQSYGVLPANGTSGRIRLYVLDNNFGRVSVSGTATITNKTGPATTPVVTTANVVNGVAEFPITTTTTAGFDVYTVALNGLTGETATIQVSTATAMFQVKPSILAIHGSSGGVNRVAAADDAMVVELPNYGSGIFGQVKVYKSGTGALVYASPVMEFVGGPSVRVPRKNLPNGSDGYYITINNGFSDSAVSDRSPAAPATVTVEVPVALNISQVRYSATTNTLTAYASGISASTSSGVIDKSKLGFVITGTGTPPNLSDPSVTCTPQNGLFTCTNVVMNPIDGTIALSAAAGWYRNDLTGEVALADSTLADNLIGPMASIKSSAVTFLPNGSAQITLYGSNLNQGYIYPEKLKFGAGISLGQPGQTVSASTSTTVTYTIPSSIASQLTNGISILVEAKPGWFINGYSDQAPAIPPQIPMFKNFSITGVNYNATTHKLSISGAGFASGTVKPENLYLVRGNGTPFTFTLPVPTVSDTLIEFTLTAGNALETSGLSGALYLASLETKLNGPGTADDVFWFMSVDNWYAKELIERAYLLVWQ